jgi:hypothetical protein
MTGVMNFSYTDFLSLKERDVALTVNVHCPYETPVQKWPNSDKAMKLSKLLINCKPNVRINRTPSERIKFGYTNFNA